MALLYSSPMALEKRYAASPIFPFSSNKTKGKGFVPLWRRARTKVRVQAFFNPFEDQPILKDALKEPVAFMGGVFAGLLRLDLNEEPLKEWIAETVEASGVTVDGLSSPEESRMEGEDDAPQQIEIE